MARAKVRKAKAKRSKRSKSKFKVRDIGDVPIASPVIKTPVPPNIAMRRV